MRTLSVNAEHRYEVEIGVNALDKITEIAKLHNKVLLIAPNSLINKFKIKAGGNLYLFGTSDGETQKSLSTLERAWRRCAIEGIKRNDAIIGLGGGATTDLAGFVAATWLRGIDWYALPTSLAGMVDASVGGKTGINSSAGKNLIGSFHSPRQVLIDLDFLKKLPTRDLSAGMAEVIKCGFIADKKILELLQKDSLDFESIVFRSIRVKSDVVSQDFKESKLREILNYGHTLGHAIEKNSSYKLRHGEAVSIGMVFAAELSAQLAGLNQEVVNLHRQILGSFKLPITYPAKNKAKVLALLQQDKKVKSSKIRFIGLKKIGKPIWLEDVSINQLVDVYGRIAK
jgi:3-dehydroquinate synthase